MAHLLIISPTPTHPTDAGNRARIKTMVSALKNQGHTFVFLHFRREKGDSAAMHAAWGASYLGVDYKAPDSSLRRRWRRALQLLSPRLGHQYGVDEWYDPNMDESIKALVARQKFDAVLVQYVFFSKALLNFPTDTLKLIDTHDRFADRYKRFLEEGIQPKWFSCSAAAERRGLSRADRVLAIQDNEAEQFRAQGIQGVLTVGHPVANNPLKETYPGSKIVVIVGSSNSINIDSTRWFCDNVWPIVSAEQPHARLKIAGSVCDDLSPATGIELLGRVDDLSALYESAQIVVNPMLTGTGLKIKTIEALGQGRAMVSTTAGRAGIQIDNALLTADTPAEMSKAVNDLLADPLRCAELGQIASDYARSYNEECHTALRLLFDDSQFT